MKKATGLKILVAVFFLIGSLGISFEVSNLFFSPIMNLSLAKRIFSVMVWAGFVGAILGILANRRWGALVGAVSTLGAAVLLKLEHSPVDPLALVSYALIGVALTIALYNSGSKEYN